jgi:hypothetical protein
MIFLDNSITEYEERKKEVEDKVLTDEIIKYCEQNSIIKNHRQEQSYESARAILENCATYLLRGQYAENNIMTIFNIRKAQTMEIPASTANSNAEDLMYATSNFDDNEQKSLTAGTDRIYNSDVRDDQYLSASELNRRHKREKKRRKRFKSTSGFRLEKLHSTPELNTYRVRQQFEKDGNGAFIRNEGKKIPLKNVFGQPIFDAEYVTIGGRVGLIDEKNIYQSSWCTVDTDNKFWYNNDRFEIDRDIEQYQVLKDNKCQMDKILAIPVRDGIYFFDEHIQEVPREMIRIQQK